MITKETILTKLSYIKEIAEFVGLKHTLLDLAVLVIAILAPLTESDILRRIILFSMAVGSVLGYFITAERWKGREKKETLKWQVIYFLLFVVSFLMVAFILAVLNPDFAERRNWTLQLREFLFTAMQFTNIIIGLLFGLSLFFIVSVITLSSPKLTVKE